MSAEAQGVRALIALSANLGDRARTLDSAVAHLDREEAVDVLQVSPWFETDPVGGPPGQPDYLNGALELETTLDARALLDLLLAIERVHGRVRNGVRNGPRTLDLYLLFFGSERIDTEGLVVPHPRLEERLFVLLPLACVAPERLLPGCRRTVQERLSELRLRARAPQSSARARPGASAS